MIGLEPMVFISTHKPHYKPKFITRIRLLILRIINSFPMVKPIVVILEQACRCDFLVLIFLLFCQDSLIFPHFTERPVGAMYYIIALSFE